MLNVWRFADMTSEESNEGIDLQTLDECACCPLSLRGLCSLYSDDHVFSVIGYPPVTSTSGLTSITVGEIS